MTKFTKSNGETFELPIQYIGGYHYVKISTSNLWEQLPAVLKAMENQDKPDWVTLHWTAAPYDVPFNSYQYLIGEDYVLVNLYQTRWSSFAHTWKRNSNNLGMSFMAMGGNPVRGMYPYDIRKKPKMIETAAVAVAIVKEHYGISWDRVVDHAAWAKKDGYPGQRWDIRLDVGSIIKKLMSSETLFEALLRKAKWYWDDKFTKRETPPEKSKEFKTKEKDIDKAVEVAPPVSSADTPFIDVSVKDWFADEVQRLVDLKIMSGKKTAKGHIFDPQAPVTRAEVSVIICNLLDHLEKDKE